MKILLLNEGVTFCFFVCGFEIERHRIYGRVTYEEDLNRVVYPPPGGLIYNYFPLNRILVVNIINSSILSANKKLIIFDRRLVLYR